MNITKKQLEGIIVLVVFTLFVCLSVHLLWSSKKREQPIRHADNHVDRLIVEITADNPRINGIYYFPEKIKVSDALTMAGVVEIGAYEKTILDMPLSTGKTIEIKSDGRLDILEMSNAKRFILDIPIDINRATSMDLMMAPGIGGKTAEQIVCFRREKGGFKRMEDLMKIRGIKEKKFSNLKKYFCVNCL
jgi:competence protein ComEA